jgi:hypothetical protein
VQKATGLKAKWNSIKAKKVIKDIFFIAGTSSLYTIVNRLRIVTRSISKILPNLPLPKGGITPLWQRGARPV